MHLNFFLIVFGIPVSSTNKNDHCDKTEILLKVVLNTLGHKRG